MNPAAKKTTATKWTPDAIRNLRWRLDDTQEQFAERCGCSKSLAIQWEQSPEKADGSPNPAYRPPNGMACKLFDLIDRFIAPPAPKS